MQMSESMTSLTTGLFQIKNWVRADDAVNAFGHAACLFTQDNHVSVPVPFLSVSVVVALKV